jgi:DNA-binding MarR family transcriptional regulator
MGGSETIERNVGTGHDGLIDALVQTSFITMSALSKLAADNDLSLTQLRVLGILRDRRLRMTALADFLGLDKSTMTGLVARAEGRGLLERARNPDDGRAVDVFLSVSGVELGERIFRDMEQFLSRATDGLTAGEQNRLRSLLERMLGSRA